jgi:hypothetical protein
MGRVQQILPLIFALVVIITAILSYLGIDVEGMLSRDLPWIKPIGY